jgi:hypothetical protein
VQGCLDDETVLALIEGRLSGATGVTVNLDTCGTALTLGRRLINSRRAAALACYRSCFTDRPV